MQLPFKEWVCFGLTGLIVVNFIIGLYCESGKITCLVSALRLVLIRNMNSSMETDFVQKNADRAQTKCNRFTSFVMQLFVDSSNKFGPRLGTIIIEN